MRYFTIILLLLAKTTFASDIVINSYSVEVESGGVTCSGDMSDGDNESFESGTGAFCTTDWTETDTDGVVNTYSSTDSNCGSYSLNITSNSGNTGSNRAYVNIGSTDNDVYVRFYVKAPTLASGAYIRFHMAGNDNDELAAGTYYLQIYNTGGAYQLKLRTSAGQPTDYFSLTPGNWYRLEIHAVQNSTSYLKAWDNTGTAIQTSASDYDVSYSGFNVAMQYFVFRDHNSSSTSADLLIDDVVVDIDGTDYIGAQTCN